MHDTPTIKRRPSATDLLPTKHVITKNLRSRDGIPIYADAIGNPSRPPLVFVHGSGVSGAVFNHIFQDSRYNSEFYMVRYDMRGHGRSGKPDSDDEYTSKQYAEDYAVVAEAFGLKKVLWIGWSMGAAVVADIAQHLPRDTISAVVYLAGLPSVGPILQSITTPGVRDILPTLFNTTDAALLCKAKVDFVDSIFVNPESVPYELRCTWVGISCSQGPDACRRIFTRTQDPTALYAWAKDGLPLLILHGRKDAQIVGEKLVEEMKPVYKDMTVKFFDNLGHALFYEDPDAIMESIVAFARRTIH